MRDIWESNISTHWLSLNNFLLLVLRCKIRIHYNYENYNLRKLISKEKTKNVKKVSDVGRHEIKNTTFCNSTEKIIFFFNYWPYL